MQSGLYKSLKNNLFVDIDYPEEITSLIGTAEPWKSFCALSQELKEQMVFPNHTLDPDTGYQLRSKKEGREDKEYFHAYGNMFELAKEIGKDEILVQNPILKKFFQYAVDVHTAAHQFALAIGKQLGESNPELLNLINEGKVNSLLRFLHYTNNDQTDIIAAQHFDRSLYTLHLYESASGLQFLNWDMQWEDAPIDMGKTVVFNGYRLEQLTRGETQKTWHRVVRKDGTRNRVSMVLFVWTETITDYPTEARSQDLTPSYAPRS